MLNQTRSQENDAFGPFSDDAASHTASGSDPFTLSSSFTEDDAAFDSFGDFGDFQTAEEEAGELTPTAGSWTFTSGSNTSDEWSESDHESAPVKVVKTEIDPGEEGLRTAMDGTLF